MLNAVTGNQAINVVRTLPQDSLTTSQPNQMSLLKDMSGLLRAKWLLLGLLLVISPVKANQYELAKALAFSQPQCPTQPAKQQAFNQLQQQIMAAPNLAAAQEIALAPTELASTALAEARFFMPDNADLTEAASNLNQLQARIGKAASQQQVADELAGVMLAGLDDGTLAHVGIGKGGCNYSTGETIAIVIGLILGIIPGLILLVLLC